MSQSTTSFITLDIPIHICDNFIKRARGLMFKKEPIKEYGILLIPCNFIHTYFMFQSIDVIFLNKNSYVISAYEAVKPNTILHEKEAYTTLELPLMTIRDKSISTGKKILFR